MTKWKKSVIVSLKVTKLKQSFIKKFLTSPKIFETLRSVKGTFDKTSVIWLQRVETEILAKYSKIDQN